MSKRVDLTGTTFGKLVVLSYAGSKRYASNSKNFYLCRCECGKEITAESQNLKTGNTSSCGCRWRESVSGANSSLYNGGRLKAEYRRQVKNALKRELDFTLTFEEVEAFFSGNCNYCGAAPAPDHRNLVRNGMDRLDSSKGYIKDNVVSCCFGCNHVKQDVEYSQFVERVALIYNYLNLKGA